VLKWGEDTHHRKLFLRKLYAGKDTKGDSVLEGSDANNESLES
jgi:hypothetical protein